MGLYNQFATSKEAEVKGVEVTFDNETFFRIAREGRGNKKYQRLLDLETKPHVQSIRNGVLDPKVDEAITRKLFLEAVLLGWRGVKEPLIFGTDDEVPYTRENAEKLFDALPELYHALREQAQKMSNFRAAEVETDSKN